MLIDCSFKRYNQSIKTINQITPMTASDISVSELLFPAAYRRKALALLLPTPERRLHAREIARLTHCSAGAMSKELALLHATGILDRLAVGNQVHYCANTRHPVYPELRALLQKTVGLVDVLRDALAPLAKRITVAFVFGSVARGAEQAASDVDVILIGTVDFGEVTKALYPAQQALGREINPKVFSCAEWRSRLAAESTFLSDVMSKPKLFIEGTEDELDLLGKSGQDTPA